jgi:hypothetical protein
MRLIITIQGHVTVHLCDLQLSPYRVMLQYVYVTHSYHHTGSCYSTSTVCDLQLSPNMFILQFVYLTMIITIKVHITYNYQTGSYYSMLLWLTIITKKFILQYYSMGLTIITKQVHITASLCDVQLSPIQVHCTVSLCNLQLSPYRFILQ